MTKSQTRRPDPPEQQQSDEDERDLAAPDDAPSLPSPYGDDKPQDTL